MFMLVKIVNPLPKLIPFQLLLKKVTNSMIESNQSHIISHVRGPMGWSKKENYFIINTQSAYHMSWNMDSKSLRSN